MSDFSIGESVAGIPALVEKALRLNVRSLALSDRELSGAIKFYLLCKEKGLKPLIGQKIGCGKNERTFLCKDFAAYKILCLHSLEFQVVNEENAADEAGSKAETFLSKEECGHFICLSAFDDPSLRELFGQDFYLQIDFAELKKHPERYKNLDDVQAVAANPVRYLEKDDFDALSALRKYLGLPTENSDFLQDKYFAGEDEILPFLQKMNLEALSENTKRVAEKIQDIFPEDYFSNREIFKRMQESLPEFDDAQNLIRRLAWESFEEKRNEFKDEDEAKARLESELQCILSRHWEGVFLFHHELAAWCRQNGIARGMGRGSAVSSFLGYLLGITEVNPLKYGLLFERFVNPEWEFCPLFDIDFAPEHLDKVQAHLMEKYCGQNVVRHSAFRPRESLGRALLIAGEFFGYPRRKIKRIADILLFFRKPNFEDLMNKDSDVYKGKISRKYRNEIWRFVSDKKNARILRLAKKITGVETESALHPAGFIVTKNPASTYVPVLKDKKSSLFYAAYDREYLGLAGLYTQYFIELQELTKLRLVFDEISKSTKENFDLKSILSGFNDEHIDEFIDKKVMSEFAKGNTGGIFLFRGGKYMRKNLRTFAPETFSDLVLIRSLYRPKLIELVSDIIRRRRKGDGAVPLIAGCDSILRETYGVPVYDEQIMQILHFLAGYSYGEADILRRKMKKADIKIFQKKEEFIQKAAQKQAMPEEEAAEIFDKLVFFSALTVIKSHAISYTMTGVLEMYLKIYFPGEFKKARFNS